MELYVSHLTRSIYENWLLCLNHEREYAYPDPPELGVWVLHANTTFVAGMALYKGGPFLHCEFLATEQRHDSATRHAALDLVIQQAISYAAMAGLKLLAYPLTIAVSDRFARHGLRTEPCSIMSLGAGPLKVPCRSVSSTAGETAASRAEVD